MARRLATIARYINENVTGYGAKVVAGYCNTDRKLSRGVSWKGKGRHGNRIIVYRKENKEVVLDHNSAQTYRSNDEVEDFVQRVEGGWVPSALNSPGAKWLI